MMKILEVSFWDLQKIVAFRQIRSKFYTKDLMGEKVIVLNLLSAKIINEETKFLGCDNSTGEAFIGEFEYLEDCINWLENNLK